MLKKSSLASGAMTGIPLWLGAKEAPMYTPKTASCTARKLTAMPGGIACYLAVAAAKAKEAKLDQYAKALLVAGVLGVLGTVAFAVAAGQSDGSALGFAAASAVLTGVAPAIVGALLPKKPQQA